MANFLQNMAGMSDLTEQVIAAGFLLDAKNGIKNYAAALSETASPQVRMVLKRQLDDAVDLHEKITNYMLDKGYYYAYDPQSQMKADMKATDKVLELKTE